MGGPSYGFFGAGRDLSDCEVVPDFAGPYGEAATDDDVICVSGAGELERVAAGTAAAVFEFDLLGVEESAASSPSALGNFACEPPLAAACDSAHNAVFAISTQQIARSMLAVRIVSFTG